MLCDPDEICKQVSLVLFSELSAGFRKWGTGQAPSKQINTLEFSSIKGLYVRLCAFKHPPVGTVQLKGFPRMGVNFAKAYVPKTSCFEPERLAPCTGTKLK